MTIDRSTQHQSTWVGENDEIGDSHFAGWGHHAYLKRCPPQVKPQRGSDEPWRGHG